MLDFKFSMKSTIDLQKIQNFRDKVDVEILVGFKSGEQHIEAVHTNPDGERVTFDGKAPDQIQPIDNDELAKQLHFGTATIPARPFLEDGILSKKEELREELEKQAKRVHEGENANWEKVGTMAVGAVQEFVRSDHYKNTTPNSQKTIDYKGSDTPLIDSANLINSCTFVVTGKGK